MQARTNNRPAARTSPRRTRRSRWALIVELVGVIGAVFALIWVVQPLDLPGLDLSLRILIVASMLISNFAHRDSFRSLGLRIDNLPRAASGALPATATAAGI